MRRIQTAHPHRQFVLPLIVVAIVMQSFAVSTSAQTAKWVWNPDQKQGEVPIGDCYFRKKFKVERPRQVLLKVAANDKYEVHINNQLVAVGETTEIKTFDVGSAIKAGTNAIAVKVTNSKGNTAGFAAAVVIQQPNDQWRVIATDNTWKTSTKVISIWRTSVYNDSKWKLTYILESDRKKKTPARNASSSSNQKVTEKTETQKQTNPEPHKSEKSATATISDKTTASNSDSTLVEPETEIPVQPETKSEKPTPLQPRISKPKPAKIPAKDDPGQPIVRTNRSSKKTYKIQEEFEVRKILDGKHGSYIAMAFNEFGQTIVACEGKGLIKIDFTKEATGASRVKEICQSVKNIQGILPINGKLYVTGDGPQGIALYELSDRNRDGVFESTKVILKFLGKPGEHGPHGLRLGPDGMIYVIIGNQSGVDQSRLAKTSPYKGAYECDSLQIYEDPGGHALGVKAPGGMVIRLKMDGSQVEAVAGGIRNAYDLVFNEYGDLFIHDSDMEADLGLPWYRDTQLFHVTPGAEIGWRRGWSKWPEYFIDGSKPVAKTGSGSPTGAVSYQHVMFPIRYHNALFLGDWLNGRIISAQLKPEGATYRAKTETFFEADGMTITDLAVGPDGALYFCTGGRGTEGAIYRIHWTGTVPDAFTNLTSDVAKIVRSPEPMSPWTMQEKALLKIKMGAQWSRTVRGIVNESANKPVYRQNAINAMLLYGPRPSVEEVVHWTSDRSSTVRRAATQLLGNLVNAQKAGAARQRAEEALIRLINDDDTYVRRAACETMLRLEMKCDPQLLESMLRSGDWSQTTAARRLLESLDVESWRKSLETTTDIALFCQLGATLIKVEPNLKNAYQILVRYSELSEGHISDEDFVAMLRLNQLAIALGKVDPEKIPAFTTRISNEFPSKNERINRELARLLAQLKSAKLENRLSEYFENSSDSATYKLSVAMHLQTISNRLNSGDRIAIIKFLETQKDRSQVGSSYTHYIAQAIRDMASHLSESEYDTVLENGAKWQNAALAVFYRLNEVSSERVQKIIEIDKALADRTDSASIKLKLATIAMLSGSKDMDAMDYLRSAWRNQKERRSDIVIGLAQQPEGKNWPYLVASLSQIDDDSTSEVISKLLTVDRRPQESKHYRTLIEAGYRLRKNGGTKAAQLLKHWTDQPIETNYSSWKDTLDRWNQWFRDTYPDEKPITIQTEEKIGKWSAEDLLTFLEENAIGNPMHGKVVFAKANCAKCHRYSGIGEMMGPDLTLISRRFSKREVLDSILKPSRIISDQYAAHQVITAEGETMIGIISRTRAGDLIVLKDDGTKVEIAKDDVDELTPVKTSAMPSHLLDKFSKQEIADLFAYLESASKAKTHTAKGASSPQRK